jgi:hypothetical protein
MMVTLAQPSEFCKAHCQMDAKLHSSSVIMQVRSKKVFTLGVFVKNTLLQMSELHDWIFINASLSFPFSVPKWKTLVTENMKKK